MLVCVGLLANSTRSWAEPNLIEGVPNQIEDAPSESASPIPEPQSSAQSEQQNSQTTIFEPPANSANRPRPKRLRGAQTDDQFIHEKLTFAIGSYFSHGDYSSTEATDVISIPFRASYQRDNWSFHAQIPYLNITGPENVLVLREGGELIIEASEEDTRRQGFGDLRLSSQYALPWKPFPNTGLNIGGGIKLPTADESEHLGTGETDYQLFSSGYLRSGRWITDLKVGHQWMEDTDNTDYNNRLFFSMGERYLFSRSQSLSLSYSHKEAATESSEAVQSLTATFHQKLNYGWKLSFSAGMGFGESSADYFGGLQISKSFIRKKRR
ncbi:transporter [Litoribrevibacter albus]|uniref:Uncharacterized protein n=1 Tax=Litoribrevibacter albus TaxID=1473156 RepID=A0AA37W7Z1_9GAMM|nr:transporter [Litoribrevibacter albus]GLQ33325.1 hypothetical protein GCM10007876_38050 [Litoribrevibacter albus]